MFSQTQKQWQEPGKCDVKQHDYFVSTHPGEDRDSDSEEEGEANSQQLPLPIQDEAVEETRDEESNAVEMQEVPDVDVEMANQDSDEQVRDTGEVENDE